MKVLIFLILVLFFCNLFKKEEDYFPLKEGYSWFYEGCHTVSYGIKIDTLYKIRLTRVVQEKITLDNGQAAFKIEEKKERIFPETTLVDEKYYYLQKERNYIFYYEEKSQINPDTLLIFPFSPMKRWFFKGKLVIVLNPEDVTLPDGEEYKSSWKIQRPTELPPIGEVPELVWFYNGIGEIRCLSEYQFGGLNYTIHSWLTDFKFK